MDLILLLATLTLTVFILANIKALRPKKESLALQPIKIEKERKVKK